MRATAARLGDALLRRVLPMADAGACIIGTGSKCKCGSPCNTSHCTQYYVSCTGGCIRGEVNYNC
jgi:hypothetical protein